jgi:hypothetical protein
MDGGKGLSEWAPGPELLAQMRQARVKSLFFSLRVGSFDFVGGKEKVIAGKSEL